MIASHGVQIKKGTAQKDGGCNFCPRSSPLIRVYIVKSDTGGVTVRFCTLCFAALKAVTEYVRLRPRVTGEICLPNGNSLGRREPLPEFLVEVWEKRGRPEQIDSTNPFKNIREEADDLEDRS